ncbi:MAG: ATP-binding cassette domain-containing protein [Gammaproteobacteria bacterium]|nr:ATP-binding cassette domain-containing protein [Gammaproteobacteria bacterium]
MATSSENLSGGETQRVALAEALLKPSRVLLLDEPMSNVDKSRKGEFGALVRDLAREKGLVVLYISHDEWELFLTADRLAITEDGQMLQVGHYQEISGAPVSGKVAAIGRLSGCRR